MTDWAARAEEGGLNALPAPQQVLLDGWLLRFAGGCTRRANSVNPLRPGPYADLDGRIAAAAALYARQGLPCLFRLPSFLGDGLDAALDRHGYAPADGESRILFSARLDGEPAADVELTPQPGAEWLAAQAAINGDAPRVAAARAAMLAGLAIPAAFAAARLDGPGTPLASLGYMAVHRGLACLNMVATAPAARRRGLSRRVLRHLMAWAAAEGAEAACLQVGGDNRVAIGMYEGLGFGRELYRYHYRQG